MQELLDILYRLRLGAIRRTQFATDDAILTSQEPLSQRVQDEVPSGDEEQAARAPQAPEVEQTADEPQAPGEEQAVHEPQAPGEEQAVRVPLSPEVQQAVHVPLSPEV
jgi:hypothetical protein